MAYTKKVVDLGLKLSKRVKVPEECIETVKSMRYRTKDWEQIISLVFANGVECRRLIAHAQTIIDDCNMPVSLLYMYVQKAGVFHIAQYEYNSLEELLSPTSQVAVRTPLGHTEAFAKLCADTIEAGLQELFRCFVGDLTNDGTAFSKMLTWKPYIGRGVAAFLDSTASFDHSSRGDSI